MSMNMLLPESSSLTGQYLLGYHGCKKSVGESIIDGSTKHLNKSENEYDPGLVVGYIFGLIVLPALSIGQ